MNGNHGRDMIQSAYGKTKEETQKWNKKTLCEYTISELPLSSVSNEPPCETIQMKICSNVQNKLVFRWNIDFPDD